MRVMELGIVLASEGAYAPGDAIEGCVLWEGGQPASLQLRLFWFTQGKGTQDVEVVEALNLNPSGESGEVPFQLIAPGKPHSFSGKLLSLGWALEAIGKPNGLARQDVVIAPERREINLYNA
jgi:hypothetical protein